MLDPFAGIGTALLAAAPDVHRRVGYEVSPDYVALAERRLRATLPRGVQLSNPPHSAPSASISTSPAASI